MNTAELRGKTKDELDTILVELKKETFNLRFQRTSGELEKTSRVREVRKTIARIKTLQKEQNLGIVRALSTAKPAKASAKKEKAAKPAAADSKEKSAKPAKATKKTTKKAAE